MDEEEIEEEEEEEEEDSSSLKVRKICGDDDHVDAKVVINFLCIHDEELLLTPTKFDATVSVNYKS